MLGLVLKANVQQNRITNASVSVLFAMRVKYIWLRKSISHGYFKSLMGNGINIRLRQPHRSKNAPDGTHYCVYDKTEEVRFVERLEGIWSETVVRVQ